MWQSPRLKSEETDWRTAVIAQRLLSLPRRFAQILLSRAAAQSLCRSPGPLPWAPAALGFLRHMAKAVELKLKVGDRAPDFAAPGLGGKQISLSDLKGKPVVLYFYPKDDTPGCTKEACGFRDGFADFKEAGAVVLGVSVDSVKSHAKFAAKFSLPFILLADEDKFIVQAYGVWGQKKFMGRTYMGTHRVTFLIGPDGRIAKIWPAVKPEDHAAEVLAALRTESP
jgi:peroxiredoxin Q/BCP